MMGETHEEASVNRNGHSRPLVNARIGKGNGERSVVLVTGDSPGLSRELRDLLKECGCNVLALSSDEGLDGPSRARPDVVIINFDTLDEMSPEHVQAMREGYGKPVACLLPYPAEQDIAAVAQLGADGIVFKPLCAEDFTIRIQLLLWRKRPGNSYPVVDRRRRSRRKEDGAATRDPAGPQSHFLRIDERARAVWCNGHSVMLTPKEYLLLSLLASDAGRVFSVDEIIATLWPTSGRATAADVHQYIYALRKKIEEDPRSPRCIITVSSFGYMLARWGRAQSGSR